MIKKRQTRILIIDFERDVTSESIKLLKDSYETVNWAISLTVFDMILKSCENKGGLSFYDIIILAPSFNAHPKYNYDETRKGVYSGLFLYRDHLVDLDAKIIIWCHMPTNYRPVPSLNSDPCFDAVGIRWGNNVVEFAQSFGASPGKLKSLVDDHRRNKKVLVIYDRPGRYPRALKALEEEHIVERVSNIYGIENNLSRYKTEGGVNHHDIIVMDPYFNPDPAYGYKKTEEGRHTGWFICGDYLKEFEGRIIIWSPSSEWYNYPTANYPKRKWKSNVKIIPQILPTCDCLLRACNA